MCPIAFSNVLADPAYICISPTIMDQEENLNGKVNQNKKISLDDEDIELIVSDVFSSKIPEVFVSFYCFNLFFLSTYKRGFNGFQKIEVERITRHLMQGNILLQIEISMRPSLLIRYVSQPFDVLDHHAVLCLIFFLAAS